MSSWSYMNIHNVLRLQVQESTRLVVSPEHILGVIVQSLSLATAEQQFDNLECLCVERFPSLPCL
jgi:hypothetical protein